MWHWRLVQLLLKISFATIEITYSLKNIKIEKVILKCNNISQHYCYFRLMQPRWALVASLQKNKTKKHQYINLYTYKYKYTKKNSGKTLRQGLWFASMSGRRTKRTRWVFFQWWHQWDCRAQGLHSGLQSFSKPAALSEWGPCNYLRNATRPSALLVPTEELSIKLSRAQQDNDSKHSNLVVRGAFCMSQSS